MIQKITDPLVQAFARLIPQLNSDIKILTKKDLERIINSPATMLFAAFNGSTIIGTLTLVCYHTPSGCRGFIEDVIVDQDARGQGVGTALCNAALDQAKELGATHVDLTSRPEREAANSLYKKMGFVKRETNVYRYALK